MGILRMKPETSGQIQNSSNRVNVTDFVSTVWHVRVIFGWKFMEWVNTYIYISNKVDMTLYNTWHTLCTKRSVTCLKANVDLSLFYLATTDVGLSCVFQRGMRLYCDLPVLFAVITWLSLSQLELLLIERVWVDNKILNNVMTLGCEEVIL
jgi:hypothetical protein